MDVEKFTAMEVAREFEGCCRCNVIEDVLVLRFGVRLVATAKKFF